MVRVDRFVKICGMAPRTSIGGNFIIAMVAGSTIFCYGYMRSGKRIKGIVVKCRWRPGCFCMTTCAIRRKLIRGMIRICRLVKIQHVTGSASVWRIVVIAVMADSAVVGYGCMRSIEGVVIIVDCKGCRPPSRNGRVTGSAIG